MTTRLLALLMFCALLSATAQARADQPAQDAVAQSLGRQGFPWYDKATDRMRPVGAAKGSLLERLRNLGGRINRTLEPGFKAIERFLNRIGRGVERLRVFSLGQALATAMLFALLILVVVALFRLYRGVDSFDSTPPEMEALGGIAALADAPLGVRSTPADWWRLALERRGAGDLSGAVIALFVSQLVALERRGLLRFSPGRTARQYVRDLKDEGLARLLGRSLALFEQVYYGRRRPSEPVFERVWAEVERFHDSSPRSKP